jgi:hypothetical protein
VITISLLIIETNAMPFVPSVQVTEAEAALEEAELQKGLQFKNLIKAIPLRSFLLNKINKMSKECIKIGHSSSVAKGRARN